MDPLLPLFVLPRVHRVLHAPPPFRVEASCRGPTVPLCLPADGVMAGVVYEVPAPRPPRSHAVRRVCSPSLPRLRVLHSACHPLFRSARKGSCLLCTRTRTWLCVWGNGSVALAERCLLYAWRGYLASAAALNSMLLVLVRYVLCYCASGRADERKCLLLPACCVHSVSLRYVRASGVGSGLFFGQVSRLLLVLPSAGRV